MRKTTLYTIYRQKDDTLIAFEQPEAKAAEIMGLSIRALRVKTSRYKAGRYKKTKYDIFTCKVTEEDL